MLWIGLALLLACSGIVSASETALFALGRQNLFQFQRSKHWLHVQVHRLMQRPRRVLMTVLMANTAVNVAIFGLSFFALKPWRESFGIAAVAGAVVVPVCLIVFGEMLPKAVALMNAPRVAPAAAGLVTGLQAGLGPIQWLLGRWLIDPITRLLSPEAAAADVVSTEELRLLVSRSAQEGVITSEENEMLQAIVALEDVSVREVMTPRVDIRSIPIECDRPAALEAVRRSPRRRLPVCGRDLDDIRGILYARDLYLEPLRPVSALMRKPHFVPEQVRLMQLLHHFRTENVHMAIVVDEYGGTAGLVTSEDVVEWIVGALPDAETPRPAHPTERVDEKTYRLAGDLSARVWADRFAVAEVDGRFDTVGGLILAKLGRLPRVGDSVRIRNLTLTVETMRRQRIEQVLLHRENDAADESPETTRRERAT